MVEGWSRAFFLHVCRAIAAEIRDWGMSDKAEAQLHTTTCRYPISFQCGEECITLSHLRIPPTVIRVAWRMAQVAV